MFKKGLFLLAFLLFPLFAYADATVIHVTQQSPTFKITEPANPTTGYAWTVDYDHTLLHLKSEKYLVPNSKLIGAGGRTIWVFTAKPEAFANPHTQTMVKLIYARPWEKKSNATEMFFVVEFN